MTRAGASSEAISATAAAPPPAAPAVEQDTKQRIRDVALELFADQGYDGTSLRQIAERLDITKAALYYHFKSKDEIVASVLQTMLEQVDALIDWAGGQPRTAATRHEIFLRYSNIVGSSLRAMHFMQRPASGKERHPGEQFKARVQALVEILVPAHARFEHRAKAMLALVSLHIGSTVGSGHAPFDFGEQLDPDEARATMLAIAESLVSDDAPTTAPRHTRRS